MADATDKFAEQHANQLLQSGVIAQNNFIGFNKVVDYDYLEGRRMVDLVEALGAREVGSKTVPAGPNTVGQK